MNDTTNLIDTLTCNNDFLVMDNEQELLQQLRGSKCGLCSDGQPVETYCTEIGCTQYGSKIKYVYTGGDLLGQDENLYSDRFSFPATRPNNGYRRSSVDSTVSSSSCSVRIT